MILLVLLLDDDPPSLLERDDKAFTVLRLTLSNVDCESFLFFDLDLPPPPPPRALVAS